MKIQLYKPKQEKKMEDEAKNKLFESLPDEDTLADISELFKIFGDSTRIKILFCLLNNSLSVNEMVEILGIQQSAISHQLRILKENHLEIRARRKMQCLLAQRRPRCLNPEHGTRAYFRIAEAKKSSAKKLAVPELPQNQKNRRKI